MDESGNNIEAALLSAKRELREETGFTASDENYQLLMKYSGNPAMFTNWSYSFIAYDVEKTESVDFDEGEDIEFMLLPKEKVKDLLLDGTIHHPHMVAALGAFFLKGY